MSPAKLTLAHMRRYAVARTLFAPTTLRRAIDRLGFVQADPIRAPARAQDLTLRHRVRDYRNGDLERAYPRLALEEDFFVNYGFLPRATHALMHPRTPRKAWTKARAAQAENVLAFVRAQGIVHPREVDAHFQHGKTRNWFGGTSNATTHLLDDMHYRGLVRIADGASGVRRYAARAPAPSAQDPCAAMDRLIDVIVRKYAPLPARSLTGLVALLGGGAPQWTSDRRTALTRAHARLASAEIEGARWYWPAEESPLRWRLDDEVRLLAPFDPIVWDRRRFEMLWDWSYKFEAYTPAVKRVRGYYALPLLWQGRVVGWGNLSWRDARLQPAFGYASGAAPSAPGFTRALDAELERIRIFLTV